MKIAVAFVAIALATPASAQDAPAPQPEPTVTLTARELQEIIASEIARNKAEAAIRKVQAAFQRPDEKPPQPASSR